MRESGDVGALAEAMLLLDREPETAIRMGSAGRAKVRSCFSPERHMRSLVDTYELALELKAPRA
jgi:glycosyltransferase involved in cell wall biosynthesis